MRGVLLRSGRSEDFTALGETGQPVYRAALQIREAIRRKYPEHPDLVEHLAIPQSDERGSTLDWYSERPGDVIPWTSATEEERAPARAQLEVLKTRINDLSNNLLGLDAHGQPLAGSRNNAQGDTTVFGKLLTCVIPFPDENFVYLVDGRPVLTFWGFIHAGAERAREPLLCLYPKVAKAAEPVVAPPVAPPTPVPPVAPLAPPPPPVVPGTPWWRRWWWLLPLLLLLLLLLLFGLRRCTPEVVVPPTNDWPTTNNEDIDLNKRGGSVTVPGGTGNGLGNLGSGNGSAGTGAGGSPQDGSLAPGSDTATPPEQKPADGSTAPEPPAPAPESEPQPEPQPEPTQAPPAPPELPDGKQPPANAQNMLSIPPGAANGNADFLNGDWAGAGIQEVGTGKPLRLKYDFKDGKGQATVRRSDGVNCQAPVSAAMNQGQLSINSTGQAACADGSSYELPQVNCKPGATSAADCSGNYGAEAFPMLMKQAGQ